MRYNVVDYLENTCMKFPNKIVCGDDTQEITYQELWDRSDDVAALLMRHVRVRNPVPIMMKKSCKTLIVMWGIIKTGGCYVMIDPMLPEERINNILRVLDVDTVIADDDRVADKFSGLNVLMYREFCQFSNDKECVRRRIQEICDIDPLYIMFTSGSTGMPKGVAVSHRSVIDFIDHFTEIFGITDKDIIGNQAPWDFDVSVKDIYSAIKTGGRIQIIAPKYFSFPTQLMDLLEEKEVTVLIWAVSALCIVSSRGGFDYKRPSCIQKVIFSGEVMPIKQFNIWKGNYPNALFVNVYGPTEITCNCTYAILDREYREDEILPIGKSFPNERVYLVSEEEQLITTEQAGKVGEICVAGTAVALGYYNNKDESVANFVQNPFVTQYGEKMYRTGDLGYYDKEGSLFFVSRKDFQIKHLGHRIELSEIERAVNAIDGVRMSCCIYYDDEIVSFVAGDVNVKSINRELRSKLPTYMFPKQYVVLEDMPLNAHGKIDRNRLVSLLNEGSGKNG